MTIFLRAVLIAFVIVLIGLFTAWGTLALYFRLPAPELVRMGAAGGFALVGIIALLAQFTRSRLRFLAVYVIALGGVTIWWQGIDPPHDGNWAPDVARQVTGTIDGDILTLDGVRNFEWRTTEEFTENWETRSYDLSTIESVDLFMSYWAGPEIAHMLISFGFADGDYLAWSVEVRREIGDIYSPLRDMFKDHTLVLIAADERDVVGTRTNARGEDVQLYRIDADLENARALLERYVTASNAMAQQPVWYNSITTNCTTAVFWMLRTMFDGIPLDWRVFLNGYFPEYAYDRGALDTRVSFEDLRTAGRIRDKAIEVGLTPGYSEAIRVGVPNPGN